MKHLIDLSQWRAADVHALWRLAAALPSARLHGTVAWSFEGHGIRTRTTFIEAFRRLGLAYTELPGLLKTRESVRDLAAYLDAFYDLYVVRESDHARLAAFAEASQRPVINAMSAQGHPCEVLTDAWAIHQRWGDIAQVHICLWGPTTNVFRSWHELARVLALRLTHVCAAQFHQNLPHVDFASAPPAQCDIVITDAWPSGAECNATPLAAEHLHRMGAPALLPTPPFTVGAELQTDPAHYPGFLGYAQKALLLPLQQALIRTLL